MNSRLVLTVLLSLGLAAPAPAVDMDAARLHAISSRAVTLQDIGLGFLAGGELKALLKHPRLSDASRGDYWLMGRIADVDAGFRAEYPLALDGGPRYQVGATDLDAFWQAAARARAALRLARSLNDALAARLVRWAGQGDLPLALKPTEREALRDPGPARGLALAAIVARSDAAAPQPAAMNRMLYAAVVSAVALMSGQQELDAARAALPAAERQLRLLPERVTGNPTLLVDLMTVTQATGEMLQNVRESLKPLQALQEDTEALLMLLTQLAQREIGPPQGRVSPTR